MEKDFSNHFIYGNFLSNPSECFPLDCETLALLQSNIKKYAVLSLLSGCDKIILSGCEVEGQTRKDGYVFIKDADSLTGEIFFHPSQTLLNSCSIAELTDTVIANGETFPDAYVTRYVKEGGNTYLWADFTRISDISNIALKNDFQQITAANSAAIQAEASTRASAVDVLDSKIANTNLRIDAMSGVPMGTIVMWSNTVSNTIPTGWALCDGSYVKFSDGVYRQTPNYTNRFPRGTNSSSSVRSTGGSDSRSITLTTDNLPKHNHTITVGGNGTHLHKIKDYYFAENQAAIPSGLTSYTALSINNKFGSGDNDTDNDRLIYYQHSHNDSADGAHTHSATCSYTGNGQAFSVSTIPAYIAVFFIIKL